MLRGVCLHLAARGWIVTVLARDPAKLDELSRQSGGWIRGIALDYRDSTALRAALLRAIEHDSTIDLAVCWIHSDAPEAPQVIADVIARPTAPPRYVHVLGSSSADPSVVADQHEQLRIVPGIQYRRTVLGFMLEGDSSRWLTNDEIARGVIDAIESDRGETIIGTVRPWSRRP